MPHAPLIPGTWGPVATARTSSDSHMAQARYKAPNGETKSAMVRASSASGAAQTLISRMRDLGVTSAVGTLGVGVPRAD